MKHDFKSPPAIISIIICTSLLVCEVITASTYIDSESLKHYIGAIAITLLISIVAIEGVSRK